MCRGCRDNKWHDVPFDQESSLEKSEKLRDATKDIAEEDIDEDG